MGEIDLRTVATWTFVCGGCRKRLELDVSEHDQAMSRARSAGWLQTSSSGSLVCSDRCLVEAEKQRNNWLMSLHEDVVAAVLTKKIDRDVAVAMCWGVDKEQQLKLLRAYLNGSVCGATR